MIRRTDTRLLFFFMDTATTEIYTLSLHDALPILYGGLLPHSPQPFPGDMACLPNGDLTRSEEHTSELQSQSNLVCRLLLEKKNPLTIVSHFFLTPSSPPSDDGASIVTTTDTTPTT